MGVFRLPPQPVQLSPHATVARGSAYAATIRAEPGLKAYWRMGEASGNLTDLVAGKVFTAVGTPTYSATGAIFGDSDKAINFDASGDRFSTPDHADFDFGDTPFSIEFWVKRNSIGAGLFIFLSKTTQFNVYWQANVLKVDNDSSAIVAQTGTLTDTASWHHIVYSRSGPGTGNNKLYIDNVDVTTDGPGINASLTANAVALIMGAYNDGTLPALGQMDEVAFYNVALSPSKVNQHYQIGTTGTSSGASVDYSAADSVGLTDVANRVVLNLRTAADSVGQTSQVSKTAVKTAADSVGLTDALTRTVLLGRTASEGFSASEFILGETQLGTNVLAGNAALTGNGIGLSDVVAAIKSGGNVARTAADSIGLTDAVTRLVTLTRTTANSVGLTDAVTRAGTFLRTTADSVGRTDAVTRALTAVRTASDSVGRTDALTRAGTFVRTTADSVGLTDAVTRLGTFLRTAADSTGLTDAVAAVKSGGTVIRSAADSIGLTDAVTRAGTFVRTLPDSVGITDAVVAGFARVRTAADSVGVTSSVARTISLLRGASDAVGVSGVASRLWSGARTVSDAIGLTAFVDAITSGQFSETKGPSGTAFESQPQGRATESLPGGRADNDTPRGG